MLTRSAKLRRCWKLAHRSIGLTLGSILILAVFTGALMTVARPLDEWVHADLFRVAPQVSVVSGLPERQIEPVRRDDNLRQRCPLPAVLLETDGPFATKSDGTPWFPWETGQVTEMLCEFWGMRPDQVRDQLLTNLKAITSMFSTASFDNV